MAALVTGIHHITALAKDPRENHAFYTTKLGQRLVKKTVNFDDPLTYHLYFGDERGSPGTLLTHFPHPNARLGVHGSPEILESVLAVPTGSLGYWQQRLGGELVRIGGETRLAFEDPHTMRFELVERDVGGGYAGGDVAPEHAIAAIDAVSIRVPNVAQMAEFLTETMGFHAGRASEDRSEFVLDGGGVGRRLELVESPADHATSMGAGTVHHVAWRVPDDDAQRAAADRLRSAGVAVTPQMDREYFRSIYFRTPGGVIFEIATDGPGFDVDEPASELGSRLKLPAQHEPRRAEIEAHLVPLDGAST